MIEYFFLIQCNGTNIRSYCLILLCILNLLEVKAAGFAFAGALVWAFNTDKQESKPNDSLLRIGIVYCSRRSALVLFENTGLISNCNQLKFLAPNI